jgi:hypothetical protein
MSARERTTFAAQISSLDNETARRVERLVRECGASFELALLAVQDANARLQPKANRWLRFGTHR